MQPLVIFMTFLIFEISDGLAGPLGSDRIVLDLLTNDAESVTSEKTYKRDKLNEKESRDAAKAAQSKKPTILGDESAEYKRNSAIEKRRSMDDLFANLLKVESDESATNKVVRMIEKTETGIRKQLEDLAEMKRSVARRAKRFPQTFESLFGKLSRQIEEGKDTGMISKPKMKKEELLRLAEELEDLDLFSFGKRRKAKEESDENRPPRPG
eukprot:gene15303-6517_t